MTTNNEQSGQAARMHGDLVASSDVTPINPMGHTSAPIPFSLASRHRSDVADWKDMSKSSDFDRISKLHRETPRAAAAFQMIRIAYRARLWYNRGVEIVVPGSAVNTPGWINLYRRFIVNTVPHSASDGNIPLRRCKHCPEDQQWHPATLAFFPPEKKGKYGLSSLCRVCTRLKQKRHRSKPEKHERHLAYMKDYHQRPDRQEKQRAYNQRPDVKEKARISVRERQRRPEVKAKYQAYHQRPETKARINAYYAQPEQRAKRRRYAQEYLSRPDVQAERRAYQEAYLSLPHVRERKRAWTQEYWKKPRTRALYQANRQRRRASLHAAQGYHTPEQIQEQYQRQKGRCYYCHSKVARDAFHVDHILPLSRGGSNDISNIVIACAPCNLSKRDKLPHEFFKGGRLL